MQRQFEEDFRATNRPQQNLYPDVVFKSQATLGQQKNDTFNETFSLHPKRGSEDLRERYAAESWNDSWHNIPGERSSIKESIKERSSIKESIKERYSIKGSIDFSHNHLDKPEFLDDIWSNRYLVSSSGKTKQMNVRELLILKQKKDIQIQKSQITELTREQLLKQQEYFGKDLQDSDRNLRCHH